MTAGDAFDVLRGHVRSLDVPTSEIGDDELIDAIIGAGAESAGTPAPRRSRGRRTAVVAVSGAVAVAVAGGAWSAAANEHHERPTVGESTVSCRSTAGVGGLQFAVTASDDPIAACEAVWRSGQLGPSPDGNDPPSLAACVGPTGVLAVVPDAEQGCSALGMPTAADSASP